MAVIRHIIGSLGDIGAEIVKETAKAPGDIAGKALESLGTPAGKNPQLQKNTGTDSLKGTVLEKDTGAGNKQQKKAQARRMLEEYVGYGKPKKEPTVWEEKQMEEEQKKKVRKEKEKKAEKQALPKISTKPKPGNLYGIADKSSSERSKNVLAE